MAIMNFSPDIIRVCMRGRLRWPGMLIRTRARDARGKEKESSAALLRRFRGQLCAGRAVPALHGCRQVEGACVSVHER